jgi:glycosyltransferase XagB
MARVLPFSPAAIASRPSAPPAPEHLRLGDALIGSGVLDRGMLARALDAQQHQDQRLGRILMVSGAISDEDLLAALARQSGLGQIDLTASPSDPDLLRDIDPYGCLEIEAVPWRLIGGTLVVAIADPSRAEEVRDRFSGEELRVALALAPAAEIRRTITRQCSDRLRRDARLRCPEDYSCRGWTAPGRRRGGWVAFAAACGVSIAAPMAVLQAIMLWVLVANAATTALRLTALAARRSRTLRRSEAQAPRLVEHRKLPRVSLLVPLLREEKVAQRLLDALAAMDYPAALLDIKLVLEEDDTVTRAAVGRAVMPPTIDVVTVPADALRTKPRAMNYALPFCEGEIVGVYDAEDRPDPAQIRAVVAHLQAAPPEVACVQGYLDFYNTDENWMSRCFTLEYAIWFRVVLLGVQRLGLPIPLGGTTVFFRREVLERIGAWDAHNVTEDADLGMRLARFGYRCEMIPSVTMEEATFRTMPWIRQRSRWLKGYAVTWATHMQRPAALWRDLGPRGFAGFQVLFLGSLTSYLSLPLFWAIGMAGLGFGFGFWSSFSGWLMWGLFASMAAGQATMVAVAVAAARDAGRPGLARWVLALPFYTTLGAVAAYRAIGEIFTRPSYWHKTEHGVGQAAGA